MKKINYILLCVGMILSIHLHAEKILDYPLDTINGQVYYRYIVERSIGLYRISKNFGVTQEEILRANPHLQYSGLHYDEVILIPAKGILLQEVEPVMVEIPAELQAPIEPVIDSTTIRVALLLPLHADAIKRDKNMDRFYDFYAGALIAIHDVQATGQSIEVFVYDVGKSAQKTIELLSDSIRKPVDAIIGPAYSQQVTAAAEFAMKDSTWLLVPFLSKVNGMMHHPYMLKFNPSAEAEADTLARYLAQYGDSVNCVLVEAREGDVIPQGIMAIRNALTEHNVPTTSISLAAILTDSLDGAFKPDMENIVIFNTEKYSNLHTVMPHLLTGYSTYKITLFSHYSWQNEKIILPQIYTSVFTDSLAVGATYDDLYNTYFNHKQSSLQPRYDLLGYDLVRHMLTMLQTSATDTLDMTLWRGMQSDIQYHKVSPEGGYENRMIHIIRK